METRFQSKPFAPAIFVGVQEGSPNFPDFELFTLLRAVGEHPEGSTVSRQTLEKHGFGVPHVLGAASDSAGSTKAA